MDREKLKKLAQDKRFIPGIYNYCDRWCERCCFTSRCLNFATSEEDFSDPETRDIRNEKFWKKISKSFQVTVELLKEAAEEQGIDLDAIDVKEAEEERRLTHETAKNHEVCRMAAAYIQILIIEFKVNFLRPAYGESLNSVPSSSFTAPRGKTP